MNEEELFCKLFPEYVVNGKPLSPYFDLFESGYEQLENRIDELEAEVKEWKDKADLWCKTANLKDHNIMINKELEKENAELRKIAEFQQSSNMNTHLENKKLKEGLAVGSTWNKHLNSLNKELEEERDKYRNMVFDLQQENAELKEELKKWKDEWQEQVQKATDEGYARTLQTIQLTKAKEIIKIFLKYEICTLNIKEELADNIAKAEQFLKGVEK